MKLSEEEEKRRTEAAAERYNVAAHAMQSGVAWEMEHHPEPTESKHLRVGINSCAVTDLAIAKLLISKGIITAVEYHEAIADAMEEEVKSYETRLSDKLGKKVTLK